MVISAATFGQFIFVHLLLDVPFEKHKLYKNTALCRKEKITTTNSPPQHIAKSQINNVYKKSCLVFETTVPFGVGSGEGVQISCVLFAVNTLNS
jgi:hypothetical protein